MRLVKESIERDGSGTVTLYPEEPEDMWAAYNLIRSHDLLRASALRRVTTESATGSTSSHRVHITLTIRVKSTTFDAQAGQLHVSGQIAEETSHAKIGQFHTLDLELHRNFTLEKGEGWDTISRQVVREACDVQRGASAWAVIMEDGMAHIATLLGERTVLKQRIFSTIPGKRGDVKMHDKGVEKFFQTTLDTLLRHADLSLNLPVLLASPGYTASNFLRFILDTATRAGNKAILSQKSNFLVVHSSTGQYHGLAEVLKSQEVLTRLSNTRYARETALMDKFSASLRKDDGKAWYGHKEVHKAVEIGAVGRGGGVLLISNSLFRSLDVGVRKRWVALVDRVRDREGGEVRVLSSEHVSGRRLEALGAVAALLSYPSWDLDEDGDGDGDEKYGEGADEDGGAKLN